MTDGASVAAESRHGPMRQIVRNRETQRFLDRSGGWTESADRALNFPNFLSAVNWCIESGLRQAEVVLRLSPFDSEIAIPLDD